MPTGPREMWCTAPLFHAAGRKIYQRGEKDFVALSPPAAEKAGLADKVVRVFDFEPMRADSDQGEKGPTPTVAPPRPGTLLAVYWSRTEDRVGTVTPEPDGIPDCCVRIAGVRARRRPSRISFSPVQSRGGGNTSRPAAGGGSLTNGTGNC